MSDHHLPSNSRRIVRALIEVVKPKKPGFDLPLEDFMLEFLDEYYSHFPWHMKIAFPMGLYLLEYGTFIFEGRLKPFSRLSVSQREKSVQGWIDSKMALRRDLIKGVKGICLTAYYSHPEVMVHIGYDLPAHLARVNAGEPCNPEARDFFRGLGYDRNSRIPHAAYDNAIVTTTDTPAEK